MPASSNMATTHRGASTAAAQIVSACLVTAALSAGPAAPVAGQSGPWWEVVAGAGALRFTCDLCADDRDVGRSFHVAGGAYATRNVPLGIEAGWWSHDDDGIGERVYQVGGVGHLYPRPGSGLHLVGGLGWVGYRAGDFAYDSVNLSVGAGWDLTLTEHWVAGSRIRLDAASFGTLRDGDHAVVGDVSVSLVRLALLLKRR